MYIPPPPIQFTTIHTNGGLGQDHQRQHQTQNSFVHHLLATQPSSLTLSSASSASSMAAGVEGVNQHILHLRELARQIESRTLLAQTTIKEQQVAMQQFVVQSQSVFDEIERLMGSSPLSSQTYPIVPPTLGQGTNAATHATHTAASALSSTPTSPACLSPSAPPPPPQLSTPTTTPKKSILKQPKRKTSIKKDVLADILATPVVDLDSEDESTDQMDKVDHYISPVRRSPGTTPTHPVTVVKETPKKVPKSFSQTWTSLVKRSVKKTKKTV